MPVLSVFGLTPTDCKFLLQVSPWKQLRGGVRFVNEIPKTGSGKILRRIIRDMLKAQSKL